MNQFIPGVHILAINLYLVFLQFFKIPLYQKDSHTHFTVLNCGKYLPWTKCFFAFADQNQHQCSKLKPWTLWTADSHANVKGNWVRFMDGDANPVFIEISVSHFSIGTQELCVPT